MPPPPRFVIVGTARSGTTLVQRLACELPGVRVPPETHLLGDFLPDLERRGRRFPLQRRELVEELQRYAARPYLEGVELDAAAVAEALGGSCTSGLELFGAVVDHLAGEAPIVGEKTPDHLLWWEPLVRALPELRIVIVVRDPRAVDASFRAGGWGGPAALNAQRWKADARVARAAVETLGDRVLLLRYEDVVRDPDATRERLREHLGAGEGTVAADRQMFPGWESWKASATGPIGVDGVDRWRGQLAGRDQRTIDAICRTGMRWLEYGTGPSTPMAWATQLALPPRTQISRARRRVRRWRQERTVRRLGRDWG